MQPTTKEFVAFAAVTCGIRGSADEIQTEAEAIRAEVRGALSEIEEALRVRESMLAGTDCVQPPKFK